MAAEGGVLGIGANYCESLNRFMHAVEVSATEGQAVDALYSVLLELGFNGVAYGTTRNPRNRDGSWAALPLVTRNMPPTWQLGWEAHSPNDPFFHSVYSGCEIEWSEVHAKRRSLARSERDCLDYISDSGLHYGLTIGVRHPGRFAGVTAFGDERRAKHWDSIVTKGRPLVKLAFHYFDNVVSRRFPEKAEIQELSDRETECLYWSAKGKTAEDIGAIIGISTETVKSYLKRINLKMGTSNRSHAVAKAVTFGLFNVVD